MSIVTIIITLILAFIAWKVLTGIVKIGAIVAIIVVGLYLYSQGFMA